MSFWDNAKNKVVEVLGGVPKYAADSNQMRAYKEGFNNGKDYGGGNDEPLTADQMALGIGHGYRRYFQNMLREFDSISYDKIIESAWVIYQSNPLAKRILTLLRAYTVGKGIRYETKDETLKEILDKYWTNNKINTRIKEYSLQLSLFGEQIFPVFVRKADGRVLLGYIDPKEVQDVGFHPDNSLELWYIKARDKYYRVVREEMGLDDNRLRTAEQSELEAWEMEIVGDGGYDGDCLVWQVNKVSNQSRGFSDLLQVMDWLDLFDAVFFAIGDREQFAAYFSWFVKLTGASEPEVKERADALRHNPPRRGTVNVTNDKEDWTLNQPDLRQVPSLETVKTLLTFIVGNMGYPMHWFGFGGDTNLATATAQGDPTWVTLYDRQDYIKVQIETMLNFVKHQAELSGKWHPTEGVDNEIRVTMPDMVPKNNQIISQTMAQLATALMVAQQQGWVDQDIARRAWAKVMNEFGVEYDLDDIQQVLGDEPAGNETTDIGQEAKRFIETALNSFANSLANLIRNYKQDNEDFDEKEVIQALEGYILNA